MSAVLAMQDAGFIIGSYVITFLVVGGFAARVLAKSRRMARQVDDADKYWT